MPKIKKKEHEVQPEKEEDIEIRTGRFRLYFQNKYTIISLANDILTGILYILGSLSTVFGWPSAYGTYLYLAGGIFLTTRPILKIVRNVYIYDDAKLAKKEEKESDEETYNDDYYGDDNDEEYKKKDKTDENR